MRILIVEDEPKIAAAIKRGLEQEGFSADIVTDGDNGLSYGLSGDYDIILLDWMLPGSMDGKAVCEALRKQSVKTPILMLTARDSVGAKVAGLNSGADDYLAKPFSFDELIARIHALLRRPKQLSGMTLAAGKLVMEPAKKIVKYNRQELQLTAKEYSLLEYLLRHKSRVVSKEELITHVWSDDDNVLPNTVEVYIGYLRNKIDRPYNVNLVQTIRGFGYKIPYDIIYVYFKEEEVMFMAHVEAAARLICAASEHCTNAVCPGEVLAVKVGETSTKLIVHCPKLLDGSVPESEAEIYPTGDLVVDYQSGDDIAEWFVAIEAPVCNTVSPQEITNPFVLFNGQPSPQITTETF